jgi:hypothetical protein
LHNVSACSVMSSRNGRRAGFVIVLLDDSNRKRKTCQINRTKVVSRAVRVANTVVAIRAGSRTRQISPAREVNRAAKVVSVKVASRTGS